MSALLLTIAMLQGSAQAVAQGPALERSTPAYPWAVGEKLTRATEEATLH